jgi:hypothetical protein
MLGPKTDNTNVALTSTLTTTVLAAPAAGTKRFIRHVKIVNGGVAGTWTLGQHAAGGAPVATDAGVWGITVPIPANSSQDLAWGGDGFEMAAGGNPITGGATTATCSIHVQAFLVPA